MPSQTTFTLLHKVAKNRGFFERHCISSVRNEQNNLNNLVTNFSIKLILFPSTHSLNFDEEDDPDDDIDPFQLALNRDVQLILKLMPDKSHDEVRYMLESHQENPSRVQVCTYYLLINLPTYLIVSKSLFQASRPPVPV